MSNIKSRRCHECGEGKVYPLAKPGRTMRYKNMAALPIPAKLAIPTCDKCGAEWLDEKATEALEKALGKSYDQELQARAIGSLELITSYISQRALENALGLSQGYLSKLRSGQRVPSAELVSHLALISQNPKKRLREIEDYWKEPVRIAVSG